MKKPLIVYYSFSGSTEALANQIAAHTGGEVRPLVPLKPYAFDYNTASKEVRGEIARGYCPKLACGAEPIDAYDRIFVGSPNWFKSIAPPVLSFLRLHDFSQKTVIPFCTHGGGGFGEIERRMAEECPGAKLLLGLCVSGEAGGAQIAEWLDAIGISPRQ